MKPQRKFQKIEDKTVPFYVGHPLYPVIIIFNTLLKYLSEDFGVNHIKNDNQLIENLSKKMIIIYELQKNVPLPTFDELIEKIKQNEKSKRSKKNENKSDEDYKDDDNDDDEEEEINFT